MNLNNEFKFYKIIKVKLTLYLDFILAAILIYLGAISGK